MASLTSLEAPNANIKDLTGLEFATHLTSLDFGTQKIEGNFFNNNSISDLSPLSGLTTLERLDLSENGISDVSALSELTSLEWLGLHRNSISDVSALSGLTSLKTLDLNYNSVVDLAPLVANMGLDTGDVINVNNNPLSDTSINTHIPALQDRGINVLFGALKPAVERKE